MARFLGTRWAPPVVEGDADATRVARVLYTLLVVGIGIDLVVGPVTALAGLWTPYTFALNGPRILAFVALLILTRRGSVRLASGLFIFVLWVFVSLGLWLGEGLRSPMLLMFIPLVLIAAMLLGPLAAAVAVGMSLSSALALLVAERAVLLSSPSQPSLEQIFLGLLVTLVVVVAVALLATGEFRRANRSLQAEIAERQRLDEERQRLEDQLVQSQKMDAVGRLAGGLAHDFNNMLTVITAHGEVLEKELGPGDPRQERLEHIMEAADRASQLVRRLLVFSRRHAPQQRVVDLNHVVSEAALLLRPVLGKSVSVTTQLDPDLGGVRADPARLHQVLTNLAVNARDAMPSGGTLELETANREAGPADSVSEGRYVVLSVRDTGVGMDPGVPSPAFEPFFTTKAEGQGTGLGLTVAYGIVQQSGGHIDLESDPARGTTFRIHLPRLADQEPSEQGERAG